MKCAIRMILFSVLCSGAVYAAEEGGVVDLVVFSCDRPLQLYAFLESVQLYVSGLGQVHVVCRMSDDDYRKAYDEVKRTFPFAKFLTQGNDPSGDFKQLTLQASFHSPSAYIMFAVDDIIVKDFVDLYECTSLLEKAQAYGFYLRLGTNLTECYPLQCSQPVPPLREVASEVYTWQFNRGRCCWGYPNTVDMTIYRKKDIKPYLTMMNYTAPNPLEASWSGNCGAICGRGGLCFKTSKIVNLPLNRVQHQICNRTMNFASPRELLDVFMAGKKINISLLYKIDNKAAHMEYRPEFIDRS